MKLGCTQITYFDAATICQNIVNVDLRLGAAVLTEMQVQPTQLSKSGTLTTSAVEKDTVQSPEVATANRGDDTMK
jgi:hypothetical protein